MNEQALRCARCPVPQFRRGPRGWALLTALLVASVSPAALAGDWEIEIVDDAFNWIGSSISIAVDSAGVPHIAHGAHRSEIMRYAVKRGNEWFVEEVDVFPSGLSASIALDLNDNPCLAYFGSGSLTFARLTGGVWIRETVDAMQFDKKTALRIASDGTPRIAYGKSGDPWNIKLAAKIGGAWEIATVDSTRASGTGISMTLDDTDTAHITHWAAPQGGSGRFQRRYSVGGVSSWHNNVVDRSVENCNVIHNSIVLDAVGDIHIVYMSNSCRGMSEVRYAVGGGNRWNTTVVDSVDRSAGCSLVLDRNGSPHIIYGTQFLGLAGNSRLRYAHRDQTGQWVIERMVPGADAGEFNSLAIDARGYLHVAYFHGNGRDQWGELRYARSTRPVGGVPGDMNCDGAVNGADIDPFFLALGDPAGYAARFPNCDPLNGDMNGDGVLNGGDIDPFFQCLAGGNCP